MMAGGIDNTEAGERRLISIMNRMRTLLTPLGCTLTVDSNKAWTLIATKSEKTPPWIQAVETLGEEDPGQLLSLSELLQKHHKLTFDSFLQYLNTKRRNGSPEINPDWLKLVMEGETECEDVIMTILKKRLVEAAAEKGGRKRKKRSHKSRTERP